MAAAPSFRCVLVGEESLLIQCAELAIAAGHTVEAIATRDARIRAWASERDLLVIDSGRTLAEGLSGRAFDYLFSITYLAILPDEVLALPARGAINFHDGPLPRYAGLNAPSWALMNEEAEHGITWHEIRSGVDEGDIHVQRRFEIAPNETAFSLNARCYEAALESFPDLLAGLAAGRAPTPQDLSQRSYYGRYDRPADAAVLDFARPAHAVAALVRALDYGPRYANPVGVAKLLCRPLPDTLDAVVRVVGAEVVAGEGAAGEVLAQTDTSIDVACGEGAVRLRGFEGLDGRPLGSEALGLQVGAVLPALDAGARARIAAAAPGWARSEDFWRRRLERLEPVELPWARAATAEATVEQRLDVDLTGIPGGLAALAPVAGAAAPADPAHTLVAAFASFLRRLGGKPLFHIGYRDAALALAADGLEGLACARVPLRVAIASDTAFDAAQAELQGEVARIAQRGPWPREILARTPALRGRSDLAGGHLLPVGVAVASATGDAHLEPGECALLAVAADGSGAQCVFDARVLDADDAARLVRHFETFLRSAASEPAKRLALQQILDASERQQLLTDWNATARAGDAPLCIHEAIARQARQTPDAVAVTYADEQITYRELDERSGRLAAHLRELGAGPDALVGVFVDRSLHMVVSLLGVLKSGAAYVPLDPSYPRDRIAFMISDSGARVIVTRAALADQLPAPGPRIVCVDSQWDAIARCAPVDDAGCTPEDLAYVIYTSGSTGKPKGVMVEHRNVANFFVGMDECVAHDPPGTWLAVTSLSFDISVLELFWTLARGFKVVIYSDEERRDAERDARWRPLDFGLFMWGNDDGPGARKYELMLDAARFGDEHGFSSISTPERHFHAFGGPYPNPSVTSAAIAAVTERIQIRAGSCVLPLHHPVRVAEEWAVVDNLSNGRVGISFAAGWQPDDFVLRPENYADAKAAMFRDIEVVRSLWRGETVELSNPLGKPVEITSLPRPVQAELPVWVTTAGNPETYAEAGRRGYHILTHLLGQSIEEVGEKVIAYRRARAEAGLDPRSGRITLMLHTFVGEDDDAVRETVREPMKDYLRSSVNLIKGFAWAFPAFKRPSGKEDAPDEIDIAALTPEELDTILDFAFERYYETSGLFGTPQTCARQVERIKAIDVDEVVCLIDYGVPTQQVSESLKLLAQVREEANRAPTHAGQADMSLAGQVERHAVTHMQCTPSMAKMLTLDAPSRAALGRIEHLMVGGEALSPALADELHHLVRGDVTNMYGPTETTIWSSTQRVGGGGEEVPIGAPIANTQLYIVDDAMEPTPVGVPGELLIGGAGVVRGYHRREQLSAERFVADPFSDAPGARLYRTGDLARWRADGVVEFLGRLDHQVKLRGYRIELGEIEALLAQQPAVRECVVMAREDVPGDLRLVAYVVPEPSGGPLDGDALRAALRADLPEFMVPSAVATLSALPLTPNGKIDRGALPAPSALGALRSAAFVAPAGELEQQIASVWQQVLALDQVGREDNFFDLGGHSLLVVQVHRLLGERIEAKIGLTDLYRFPTIGSLVAHLEGGDAGLAKSRDRGTARRDSLRRRAEMRGRRGRGQRS